VAVVLQAQPVSVLGIARGLALQASKHAPCQR
jgi:hypothetical protein